MLFEMDQKVGFYFKEKIENEKGFLSAKEDEKVGRGGGAAKKGQKGAKPSLLKNKKKASKDPQQ